MPVAMVTSELELEGIYLAHYWEGEGRNGGGEQVF